MSLLQTSVSYVCKRTNIVCEMPGQDAEKKDFKITPKLCTIFLQHASCGRHNAPCEQIQNHSRALYSPGGL